MKKIGVSEMVKIYGNLTFDSGPVL